MSKLSDYRWEESKKWKEVYLEEQKRQTELIFKISLIKRKIDTCLDERDQDGFKKLTSELKACEKALKTGTPYPKSRVRERIQHNKDVV
ncbi:IDEAL domain-containing protein [Neobacillus rhizosphaerae]|uniref:IDEAL domain-containing protein n=1 Tax=Neobacillus rhizosphaerae TaxID=2880965 RepID=UPI003D2ADB93